MGTVFCRAIGGKLIKENYIQIKFQLKQAANKVAVFYRLFQWQTGNKQALVIKNFS